jgi:hypothetical protein
MYPRNEEKMMKKLALAVSLLMVGVFAFAAKASRAEEDGRIIANAEWVVEAHAAHAETFGVRGPAILRVSIMGVKNADKGFRVRVVNAQDLVSCRVAGGTCRELPSWRQESTKAFQQTEKIPSGDWSLLVENNLNVFKRMTVRVFASVRE